MRTWRTAQRSVRSLEAIPSYRRSFSRSYRRDELYRVADLLRHDVDAAEVSVQGWTRAVRKQKRIAFASVGDGSTPAAVQAVLKPEDAAALSNGAAVRLTGKWKSSIGQGQSHELHASKVEILGDNDAETSPLQPKYHTPEYLRTIPHLRGRTPYNTLLLRLRSQLIAGFTNYFAAHDFIQTHTPIITSSDCEGAGEVFTVLSNDANASPVASSTAAPTEPDHFFRTPKYLTVSSQLHLEALVHAHPKVWTLSPTFRAERSDTPRHLSEFYMLEAELAFTSELSTIMDVIESSLRNTTTTLLNNTTLLPDLLALKTAAHPQEQDDPATISPATLHDRWHSLTRPTYPRVTYADALTHLLAAHGSHPFTQPPSYETGLHAEHERHLTTTLGNNGPVFITHYPAAQKPFYMSQTPTPPTQTPSTPQPHPDTTTESFDLLLPSILELAGGSLREHRLPQLSAAMTARGLHGSELDWYKDLRRYGSVPHGGFGLGFDRLVAFLGGAGSLREVVAWPRWVGRCEG